MFYIIFILSQLDYLQVLLVSPSSTTQYIPRVLNRLRSPPHPSSPAYCKAPTKCIHLWIVEIFFLPVTQKLMAIFLKEKEIVLFKKDKLFAQAVVKLY